MAGNRKIAVNSLILFTRLIITSVITLFATRIVLIELGVADYGLYAIVGGIVTVMNFLNTSMLATSFRYIAYEIGRGTMGNPNKVFNISLSIHIILAALLIVVTETGGIYYINNYLNVIPTKIPDAIFVLRFSVFATVFTIISLPYQAVINANEKFFIRASIEVLRSILNLIAVLLLMMYLGNKLRFYSVMIFFVTLIPPSLFFIYSQLKNKNIVKLKFYKGKRDYLEMIQFTGWITTGAIAYMGVRQGAALILNLFYGTLLNAAFGIATQVNNQVMSFVKNLNQAAVPQITKSHSSGDFERSMNLLYYISKYAFFMMLLPAVPILLSINSILVLWLTKVPKYTSYFTILMIINGLIGITSSGFDAVIQATGNIRRTQIFYSGIMLSTLPIAYIMLKLNYPPYIITVIAICATITNRIAQIKILNKITEFKTSKYWNYTMIPVILVTIATIPQFFLRRLFGQDIIGIIIFSCLSIALLSITIYFLGLSGIERVAINDQFRKLIFKDINKDI